MSRPFDVGDKVVCITDNWNVDEALDANCGAFPVKDRTYTVRGHAPDEGPLSFIYLVGIISGSRTGCLWEAGWDTRGFRRVWTQPATVTVTNQQEVTA